MDAGVLVRIETVSDRIRESLVKERSRRCQYSALALHGSRPRLRRARPPPRRLGVPPGGGDRIAARALRHARGRIWAVLRACLRVAAVGIALGAGVSLALGRTCERRSSRSTPQT